MISPDSPLLLLQIGNLAITSNAIPSALAIPAYLVVCLWLSVKNKVFRWSDFGLVLLVALPQVVLMPWVAGSTPSVFSVFMLAWPILGFMAGYGAWRLTGNKPLQGWPWYRFGLLITLLLVVVDVGGAFMLSPAPGKIWQLGGAGFRDALVCAPPFFMLTFYLYLDCRSPLVFCSKRCRSANQCFHHRVQAD